ncbi:MAG: ROK family protein [Pseudomonadota bacterium]
MQLLGIDLGGTKIEGVLMSPDGDIRRRERIATSRDGYAALLQQIANFIDELDPEGNLPVGIGTPGAISPHTGLLRNSNTTCMNGQRLLEDLAAICRREIRIANDANCFALSEARDGAGAGATTVFGVILGTGVGGGIVINGQCLAGAHAVAGEWGHNPLPWPQPEELPGDACYCGRMGCIETWLSGTGLAMQHAQQGISSIDIFARAQAGDGECEALIKTYEHRLARALASVINVVDPEVIVLGGGVSNAGRLYANVPRVWGEFVFSDSVRTRLLKARYGDSSGVRGAARLWE